MKDASYKMATAFTVLVTPSSGKRKAVTRLMVKKQKQNPTHAQFLVIGRELLLRALSHAHSFLNSKVAQVSDFSLA